MFVDEPGDQRALKQKCRYRCQDWYSILLPYRQIAECDLTSRRQAGLTDAPALHFPPIILRICKSAGRYLDVARLFAPEDTNGDCSCPPAPIGHRVHRATNDLRAEEGALIRKNRRVGDR